MILPVFILYALIHNSYCSAVIGGQYNVELKVPAIKRQCGTHEQYRICGSKCPYSCDKMNKQVCCEAVCVPGCFCEDGYILLSSYGPRKCVPIDKCPKPGTLKFATKSRSVLESAKIVKLTVLRINGSDGEVSVRWKAIERTAKILIDFAESYGTLTLPDGVTSQTIDIHIKDDNIREPDKSFCVELTEATNDAKIDSNGKQNVITVIIKDDDMKPGYLLMEKPRISVSENTLPLELTVLRTGGTDGEIRTKYRSVAGTAKEFTDYKPIQGELVFREGEDRKKFVLDIINDEIWEQTEDFLVQLYEPSAAPDVRNFKPNGSQMTTVLEINDDDRKPGNIELKDPGISVKENIGRVEIPLVRTGGTDGPLRVKCKTVDGTAKAGLDYLPIDQEIEFKNGEDRKTIYITLINDEIREPLEEFEIRLYEPASDSFVPGTGSLGSKSSTTLKIINDDMKPGYLQMEKPSIEVLESAGKVTVPVVRIGGTDGQLRVWYRTVNGKATMPLDYISSKGQLIFNEGEALKLIEITILNDIIREMTEDFQVELYNPSTGPGVINFRARGTQLSTNVTIKDDDMRPGYVEMEQTNVTVKENIRIVHLWVKRTGGTDGVFRVKYQTIEGSAKPLTDFLPVRGVLEFKEGEDRKNISVIIPNNDLWEQTKTFQMQLLEPQSEFPIPSYRLLEPKTTATVAITDDDMKPGYVEFEQPSYSAVENVGTVQVVLIRYDGTDGPLTVRCRTVDGTAKRNEDFVPFTIDVNFESGQTRKSVPVTIKNDNVRENTESFLLQLVEPFFKRSNLTNLGIKRVSTFTIIDDDSKPGYIEMEKASISVIESAGIVRIPVVRIGGTDGCIKMLFRTVDGSAIRISDYAATDGEIVFNEKEDKKTISVIIINDEVREPTEIFQVELFDPSYDVKTTRPKLSTVITIIDDDKIPGVFEFQRHRVTVPESEPKVTLTIVRRNGSDGPVTIQWNTRDLTAKAGEDYKTCYESVTFEDGAVQKTIDIEIINDDIKESNEEFVVGLFATSKELTLGSINLLTVVITDDDDPSYIQFREGTTLFHAGDREVHIVVTRTGNVKCKVSVYWRTEDNSAKSGRDYSGVSQELLSFEPRETETIITIPVREGTTFETKDLFNAVLFQPSRGAVIGDPSRHKVMLMDYPQVTQHSEYLPVKEENKVSFSFKHIQVIENSGYVRVTINRTGDFKPFSVHLQTKDGTAVGNQDYRRVRGQIHFNSDEYEKTIEITINDDKEDEPNENFLVELFDPSFGTILEGMDVVTVIIVDDDSRMSTEESYEVSSQRREPSYSNSQSGESSNFNSQPEGSLTFKSQSGESYNTNSQSKHTFNPSPQIQGSLNSNSQRESTQGAKSQLQGTVNVEPNYDKEFNKDSSKNAGNYGLSSQIEGSYNERLRTGKLSDTGRPSGLSGLINLDKKIVSGLTSGLSGLIKLDKKIDSGLTSGLLSGAQTLPGLGQKPVLRNSGFNSGLVSGSHTLPGLDQPSGLSSGLLTGVLKLPMDTLSDTVGLPLGSQTDPAHPSGLLSGVLDPLGLGQPSGFLQSSSESVSGHSSGFLSGILSLPGGGRSSGLLPGAQSSSASSSGILLLPLSGTRNPPSLQYRPKPEPPASTNPKLDQPSRPGFLITCPKGLIMKSCASSCPKSCANRFNPMPCSQRGCIRACFCPDGYVKENDMSDKCIHPSECP